MKAKIIALAVILLTIVIAYKPVSNLFKQGRVSDADRQPEEISEEDNAKLFPASAPSQSSIGYIQMSEEEQDTAVEEVDAQEINDKTSPDKVMGQVNAMRSTMNSQVYQAFLCDLSAAIEKDFNIDMNSNPVAALKVIEKSPSAKKVIEKYSKNKEFLKIVNSVADIMPGLSGVLENSKGNKAALPAQNNTKEASSSGVNKSKTAFIPQSKFDTHGAISANTSAGGPIED